MSTGRLPSTDGGIQPTIVDAKGDLIVATAADTVSRLAVGSNDQVLTADSTTATGLKWAAAGAGLTWTLVNSPSGTALTSGQTVTISGLNYDNLMIIVEDVGLSNANNGISIVFNSETGVYQLNGMYTQRSSTYSMPDTSRANLTFSIDLGGISATTSSRLSGYCLLSGGKSTTNKAVQVVGMASAAGSATPYGYVAGGVYKATAATTSVSLRTFSAGHTFTNGTMWVYGA